MTGTAITLIASAFAIWAMVDIAKSSHEAKKKVLWFAVAILIPLLGPLAYYYLGRSNTFQ